MYTYAFYKLFANAFATNSRETIRTSGIIAPPPTSTLKPTMEIVAMFPPSISLKSHTVSEETVLSGGEDACDQPNVEA